MADRLLPDPEVLRQLLRYEADSGKLFWRARGPEWFEDAYRTAEGNANNWNAAYAEREAGGVGQNGYRYVRLPKRGSVLTHRIIFAMVHGRWPKICDHIDGNPLNNKADNLRDVTQATNLKNAAKWSHNTSGVTGVCWNRRINKWTAYIKVMQRSRFLGNFDDFDEACAARRGAEAKFGFSERHGK